MRTWSMFMAWALAGLPAFAVALPAPSSVTATATGTSQQVLLTWSEVTPAAQLSGYRVYYHNVSSVSGASSFFVTTTATLVSGLPDRQLRWFFVSAEDSVGFEGVTSTGVSARAFQKPDTPVLSGAALGYSGKAQLGWDLPAAYGTVLGGMRIEAVSQAITTVLGIYPPSTQAAQVSFGCGTAVTLLARAYDAFGSSSAASAPLALLQPCAPSLNAAGLGGGSVSLVWLPAAGDPVSAWEVRSATGAGFSDPLPQLLTVTASNTLAASLPLPPQGEGRWYKAYGVSPAGVTSKGSVELPLLAAPSDLRSTPYQGRVHLAWSATSALNGQSVTGWQVFYATFPLAGYGGPGQSSLVAPLAGGSAQALTVSPLADHVPYWFAVAALGGGQVGPLSSSVTAIPALPTPRFSAVTALSGSALSFSWPAVDAGAATVVAYELRSSPNADLSASSLLASVTVTTAEALSPSAGTVAWYYVSLSDSAGNSSAALSADAVRLPRLAAPLLSLVEASNTRVRLRWDPVANASDYTVHRASTASFIQLGGASSSLEAVDSAPINGAPNVYQVFARVPVGVGTAMHSSEASNAVTAYPSVLPGIPGRWGNLQQAHLTVAARSDGTVDLRWNPALPGSSAISSYRLWRGFGPQALSVVAELVGSTHNAWRDTAPPLPLSALVYGVQARDQQGSESLRVTATVGSVLPWPAPLSFSATVLSGGVRLSWATPSGQGTYALSSYRVSRRWTVNSSYAVLAHVTSRAYTDLSPDAGQGSQPGYQVQVLDVEGDLGTATTLTAQLSVAPSSGAVPLPVSGISATTLGLSITAVALDWEPNPESDVVLAYRVWRDATVLTETAAVTWTDEAPAGSSPVYQVQAVNAQGDGVSGTASPAPIYVAPPQPYPGVDATVDPDALDGSLSLRLSWLGLGEGADDYRVYAQTGPALSLGSATHLGDVTTSAFADSGVTPSTQVSYAVLPRRSGFYALTASAVSTLWTPPAPPAITGLSATASSGGALLAWDSAADAVEYWVFRSTAALPAYPPPALRLTRCTQASFDDADADGSQQQYYGVASANGLGRGALAALGALTPLGGVPQALSGQAAYTGSAVVALAWSAPAGSQYASAYNVWRATSAAILQSGSPQFLSYTSDLAYSDAVPLTNTAYYYGVAGVGLSASAASILGPLRAYAPLPQPVAPGASGAPGAVDLSWQSPDSALGITGWALSLNVDGSDWVQAVPLSVTAYRLGSLTSGALVEASLAAFNGAGASPWSLSVQARVNEAGAAQQPTAFQAVGPWPQLLSGQARVALSWTAPGATTVVLYRGEYPLALSLAAGGPVSPYYLTGMAGAFVQLTDSVQADGTWLQYAISAVGPMGLPGGESSPRAAPPLQAHSAASSLSLSGTAGDRRVDLVWTAPTTSSSAGPAALLYRLHRRSGSYQAFNALQDDPGFPVDLSSNTYVDLSVSNSALYWYYLATVDAQGVESREAAMPKDASGVPRAMQPLGPIAPPTQMLGVAGDRSATLRWVAGIAMTATASRFNVYRRPVNGDYAGSLPELTRVNASFSNVTVAVLTLRDSAPSLSPPANLTSYYYAVSVVSEWGEGPKSAEILITPFRALDPGKDDPANRALNLAVTGKKFVSLSWGPTPDQDSDQGYDLAYYRVYRSRDGGNTYDLLASQTNTAMVDESTEYGAAYTYRVVPVDTAGNEGFSYSLQTAVLPAGQNAILVFRNSFNPALGEELPMQFTVQHPGRVWVRLYTLNGEYVATVFDEEVAVASAENPFISDRKTWAGRNEAGQLVASGVYLIHLESPGFRQNARVAVIK